MQLRISSIRGVCRASIFQMPCTLQQKEVWRITPSLLLTKDLWLTSLYNLCSNFCGLWEPLLRVLWALAFLLTLMPWRNDFNLKQIRPALQAEQMCVFYTSQRRLKKRRNSRGASLAGKSEPFHRDFLHDRYSDLFFLIWSVCTCDCHPWRREFWQMCFDFCVNWQVRQSLLVRLGLTFV